MPDLSPRGQQYEKDHVHDVYEEIAEHFSSTRYKPWPIIERFLKELPDGSVGLDIGTGNGKYLAVNPNIFIVGSDRSSNLVSIAAKYRPHSVVVSDILDLPHPADSFDFVICIAVIHHLSTQDRRVEAIKSIMEPLKLDGKALIFVWALEQENSRRGWGEGQEQDVMVPWVMRGAGNRDRQNSRRTENAVPTNGFAGATNDKVFHRYYHLYHEGELERDIQAAGGRIVHAGYERDNWWAIATK